jgi:hypothetical protein
MRRLKIFVLGNGFDLAHNLETDYSSFFNWYLNQCLDIAIINNDDDINSVIDYKDELISFSILPNHNRRDKILKFKKSNNLYRKNTLIEIKSDLLNDFFKNTPLPSWKDIEYKYSLAIEQIFINYQDRAYKRSPDIENVMLKQINNQFKILTEKLEEYLVNNIDQNKIKSEFFEVFKKDKDSPFSHLVLNFNYTKTFEKYLHPNDKIINIHGTLEDIENPIIFGLGDEYSENYKKMEDRNEDEYLRNVKSIKYLLSNQYSELQKQIKIHEYIEVIILGHSCSLSDRTLLKELYNNGRCKLISIYHHNGKESFTNSLYGISRYFKNNEVMRDRVNDYDPKLCFPK